MSILVAGIDCSTQSTKVVVCDAGTGTVLRTGSAPHPDATEVDPAVWADALRSASAGGLLDGVAAVAVGGQQHGMVALDEDGRVVRPVLLPHDWLTAQLCTYGVAAARTDRGDASGTGYWSPSTGEYRTDLLRLAFGREVELPPVAGPAEP